MFRLPYVVPKSMPTINLNRFVRTGAEVFACTGFRRIAFSLARFVNGTGGGGELGMLGALPGSFRTGKVE